MAVTATCTFTLTIRGPVTVTPPANLQAEVTVNKTFQSAQFVASGGVTPYKWSVTGLPPGMALSASGLLSGTPTTVGNYTIAISVTDSSP